MTKKKEIDSLNDLLSWREQGVDGRRPRKKVRRFQESVTDVEVVEALMRGGRGGAAAVASASGDGAAREENISYISAPASSAAPANYGSASNKSSEADERSGDEGDDDTEQDDEEVESAAFGKVSVDLDERPDDSNLADAEPEEGMLIDIRDPDYIWSSAKVVKVAEGKGEAKKSITVRYDGWGKEWDETVTWPNARVARLFTYTKRVKCMAEGIIAKKRPNKNSRSGVAGSSGGAASKNHCSLWPCTVKFRMPHPAHRGRAEELLRLEVNVFVQPYGRDDGLLPGYAQESLSNGGRWMHTGRLRQWRNDVRALGNLPDNFEAAHAIAMKDDTTPGNLPAKPIEIGSLLNSVYRVFTVGGEPINGKMYTGETPIPPKLPPARREGKVTPVDVSQDFSDCSKPEGHCNERQNKRRMPEPPPPPPPTCPPPVKLVEPLYPSSVVVRFDKTQRWGASVSKGGNDLFLGSFLSQTNAMAASEMALTSVEGNESDTRQTTEEAKVDADRSSKVCVFPESGEEGRNADYKAITLEDSICAVEQQWKPENNFSLHNWTMQHVLHQGYMRGAADSSDATAVKEQESVPRAVKTSRKQAKPRRVDLEKRIYI